MVRFIISFFTVFSCFQVYAVNKIIVYPAPKGEVLNTVYSVSASGKSVPVYSAKIGAADDKIRFLAVDDLLNSAKYFDVAAFCYFDIQGSVKITVSSAAAIKSFKILPATAITQVLHKGHSITFTVNKPQNLTVELNGEIVKSLHIFVNPIDVSKPDPKDPNLIYFGPGIHTISAKTFTNNKTVYIAGGAIVKCVIGKDEQFGIEPSGLRNYNPRILLQGNNITLRGRGIIDAGDSPVHAGNFIVLNGSHLKLEGVIIRNSCGWTVPVRRSDFVDIDNIKILGYRANSDGIDICNSRNVLVQNCFVRTNDDLIVVKTWEGEGEAKNILVKNCILWNPFAHALSLGAELRENISNVTFKDCDILHDTGREWTLRIFQSDSSTISKITFENLRINDSKNLVSIWIGKNVHSLKQSAGLVNNVIFKNIVAEGSPLIVRLDGFDDHHRIDNVTFSNIILNKNKLLPGVIIQNQFVNNVIVK